MRRSLDDELVPLAAAVAVVYFDLTGMRLPDTAAQGRDEVIRLIAIALAQVAEIVVRNGRGERVITARELGKADDLERFFIRRSDLRAATGTLGRIWRELTPALSPS